MCEADSADRKDTEAQVLGLAAEVCQRYRLIAVPWLNEHAKNRVQTFDNDCSLGKLLRYGFEQINTLG